MPNRIDLASRCAVVTGGAQGIGRATTERFAASGARVAIWDLDHATAEKTATAVGHGTIAVAVDVTDLASVEKAREATLKAFGRIDILVNNAGIAGANASTWETTVAEWRRVMAINLDGPFVCCKALAPLMIKQNYGRIVNIASIAGKGYRGTSNVAYAGTKGAVIAMTRIAASQLARYAINVNAICPGVTRTALFDQVIDELVARNGGTREQAEATAVRSIPLRRVNEPSDIASLAVYLASDSARNVTGQSWNVDGGLLWD